MTQGMMTSPDVGIARQNFINQGGGTYGPTGVRFGVNAEDGPFEAGLNMPRQFVGSFTITIKKQRNGDAMFVLQNTTHLKSLLYQMPGSSRLTDQRWLLFQTRRRRTFGLKERSFQDNDETRVCWLASRAGATWKMAAGMVVSTNDHLISLAGRNIDTTGVSKAGLVRGSTNDTRFDVALVD
jgi:hypothetical protein